MRAQVADAFLGKFQLKTEEVKILRGSRDGTLHPVRFNMCYFDVIVVFVQSWVDHLNPLRFNPLLLKSSSRNCCLDQ